MEGGGGGSSSGADAGAAAMAAVAASPPAASTAAAAATRSVSSSSSSTVDTVYQYDFGREVGAGLRIRERAPAQHSLDDPACKAFREKASDDVTGWSVWASSVLLGHWLQASERAAALFSGCGARVLELGSGCGVAGLAAAVRRTAPPADVTLSDLHAATLDNLRHNVQLNSDAEVDAPAAAAAAGGDVTLRNGCRLHVARMDWDDESTWPHAPGGGGVAQYDVVVAADATYKRSYARKLGVVVDATLAPGGTLVYASPAARDGLPLLRTILARAGYEVADIEVPAGWRTNPLATSGGDPAVTYVADADAAPLFPELFMSGYDFELFTARRPVAAV